MLLTPKVSKYRVTVGDSLWKIAATQYGNPAVWPSISEANHLRDRDLILVGMWLKLPPVLAAHEHSHSRIHSHTSEHILPSATGHSILTRNAARLPGPAGSSGSPKTGTNLPLNSWQSLHNGGRPAAPVLYPALKYKLDNSPPIVLSTPEADFSLRFVGEVTLQRKGTMAEIELTEKGNISEKLKAEYKSKLTNLGSSVKIGFNPKTRDVQVSCGFSVASKIDGKVFATSQYDFIPPNRLKYGFKTTQIQGESGNFVFTGLVGFELEITLKTPLSGPLLRPIPTPVLRRNPVWPWVVAGSLVFAAGLVVVGDIIKDVATSGVGLAESPVSFAAASALLSQAVAQVH
jgi:LysM repeat protein